MYLIFDTETTGLPKRWNAPITDTNNWPRCVQIAWQLHDAMGLCIEHKDFLIKPQGFNIPYDAEKIHGISTALATAQGEPIEEVLEQFNKALSKSKFVVGQNLGFDLNIMGSEFYRASIGTPLLEIPVLDTCTDQTAALCKIPGGRGGNYKWPTLTELYQFLFKKSFAEAHNATADVEATARCFFELVRKGQYTTTQLLSESNYIKKFNEAHPTTIPLLGLKHVNLKKESQKVNKLEKQSISSISSEANEENQQTPAVNFVHLHNHSQFSVLQSTISIKKMVEATAKNNMPAVALTDHANLMGAFHFVKAITNYNKTIAAKNEEAMAKGETPQQTQIKPILGCEFYVCEDRLDKSIKDNGYQIVLLAKSKKGYNNLAKLSSLAFTEGFYYVPRIDKKIIEAYKEDLIVLTGNLYGEVPSKILNIGIKQAEEALLWWKSIFGEDLYIEIMRHGQEDEDRANLDLIALSKKHQVKLIATNNTYYIAKEDANAHDILLCVKDGEKQETPIGRGRGYRYGLPNQEYYFKSSAAMSQLFKDLPEALHNIEEVVSKIESYDLAREVLLPKFNIPEEFINNKDLEDGGKRGENKYLKHLTYEGAAKRYPNLTPEIKERITFELDVIEKTGYPGYFLIVQDLIAAARSMDVSVGPGRGSAAGSVVAYCLWITNIDPLKYDLLFERFLNPDRVSLPDIDIDFDDEGRGRVMDYVISKYGSNQVAQIITYGTMAAKSAIRDTARVLDLPLSEADKIAKLVPTMSKLEKIFKLDETQLKQKFRPEDLQKINQLLNISDGDDLEAATVNQAKILEGSLRNTGIHACGVIITPDDITNFVPITTAKDSELYVTQFDNAVVEDAGLLKMDFLGLKTLTLIKDTVKIVKAKHQVQLDPDNFPLDDEKTYQLFQKGETVGVFQYESVGMQKHLKELKPTVFDDLIAMNALYRPGPMEYIPSFIKRKNGNETITYDLPIMEEYLKETYGITVYQEQVMLLSQSLAGFSKGEADVLRKAMGKKILALLEKLKPKFLDGGEANGHPRSILEKVWKDWEAFASYAFNKSHSTCYAWIAYQTAYLKAHYPAEYMAAVLSNNMNDIKSVTFFMEECRRMKIKVLGPDVNESYYKFSVNKDNAIRFGMGAVKGVGHNAVVTIVENRKKDGAYNSIFDLTNRIDLRAANKKALENLVLAGGVDCFENTHRAQYFYNGGEGLTFLEKTIRHGNKTQERKNSAQLSLFGDQSEVQIAEPLMPICDEWGTMETLAREKEVVGIYISGHPLDDFKIEMKAFCNATVGVFHNLEQLINKELSFGGIVTEVQHRVSKQGKGWGMFSVEDFTDSYEFKIFGEDYLKFKHFLIKNAFLFIKAKVNEGWTNRETGQKSDPRIQYLHFQLLHDIMDTYAKSLNIQLDIKEISEEKIELLKDILKLHKGKHKVSFVIYDNDDALKLTMPSRKQKIKISQELLQTLEEEELFYKLN